MVADSEVDEVPGCDSGLSGFESRQSPKKIDMGYKDPEKQRAYAREWIRKRRQKWFSQNGPCIKCGSWENLELDHIEPEKKISHNVWSWSQQRRDKELSKCQVLCQECHKAKTAEDKIGPIKHGNGGYRLGCRCETCTEEHTMKKRSWRARRRLNNLSYT